MTANFYLDSADYWRSACETALAERDVARDALVRLVALPDLPVTAYEIVLAALSTEDPDE
jgi:hypothetical protein